MPISRRRFLIVGDFHFSLPVNDALGLIVDPHIHLDFPLLQKPFLGRTGGQDNTAPTGRSKFDVILAFTIRVTTAVPRGNNQHAMAGRFQRRDIGERGSQREQVEGAVEIENDR